MPRRKAGRQSNPATIPKTAKQHIHWRRIRTYRTTYVPSASLKPGQKDLGSKAHPSVLQTITTYTVSKPPKYRSFRSAGGIRKYKAVEIKTKLTEVIIVASTKNRKKPVKDEELEELEALEELEELDDEEEEEEVDEVEDDDEDEEDEEEDEDEEDDEEEEDEDDEEEEDEEPTPKRRNKSAAKASTKKASSKRGSRPDDGKVGTQEVAEHFGVDGRTLRIVLRKHGIEKDPDSNQYRWKSLKSPEVIKIGKLLKGGAAEKAKKESLDKLKARKAEATNAKSTTAKKSTSTTAKKKGKKATS